MRSTSVPISCGELISTFTPIPSSRFENPAHLACSARGVPSDENKDSANELFILLRVTTSAVPSKQRCRASCFDWNKTSTTQLPP